MTERARTPHRTREILRRLQLREGVEEADVLGEIERAADWAPNAARLRAASITVAQERKQLAAIRKSAMALAQAWNAGSGQTRLTLYHHWPRESPIDDYVKLPATLEALQEAAAHEPRRFMDEYEPGRGPKGDAGSLVLADRLYPIFRHATGQEPTYSAPESEAGSLFVSLVEAAFADYGFAGDAHYYVRKIVSQRKNAGRA